jgi:hypothetical protein
MHGKVNISTLSKESRGCHEKLLKFVLIYPVSLSFETRYPHRSGPESRLALYEPSALPYLRRGNSRFPVLKFIIIFSIINILL